MLGWVALMSLPMMLATRSIERRRLLVFVFIVFIACHGLSGVAWSFEVAGGQPHRHRLRHAVVWSITASLAVRIAPAGKQTPGPRLLATGTCLAMVLGIPLGRVLGELLGWRYTFVAIAALAVGTVLWLARKPAAVPSENSGSPGQPAGAVQAPGAAVHLPAHHPGGDRPLHRLQLHRALRRGGGRHGWYADHPPCCCCSAAPASSARCCSAATA